MNRNRKRLVIGGVLVVLCLLGFFSPELHQRLPRIVADFMELVLFLGLIALLGYAKSGKTTPYLNFKLPTPEKVAIVLLFGLLLLQLVAPSVTARWIHPALLPVAIVAIAAWQYHRKRMSGKDLVIVAILAGWIGALLFSPYLRTSISILVLQIVVIGVVFIALAVRSHRNSDSHPTE